MRICASLPADCARAASGQPIAAPPGAVMNCRLPIPIGICPEIYSPLFGLIRNFSPVARLP
jgi:hypothetical protein